MNQSINTDSKNSKETQQKYRLGTVSIKILGGLNRFYDRDLDLKSVTLILRSCTGIGMILHKILDKALS